MRTDLVPFLFSNPHGPNTEMLVHSILFQRKDERPAEPKLITVFPVTHEFGNALFNPSTYGDSVPLKLRYNAALPVTIPSEKMVGKRTPTE
jgi:hypothetical protein